MIRIVNISMGLTWQQKTYIFVGVTAIAGGYFLQITHDIFGFLLDPFIAWKLDFFPLISVKNILGALLLWLALAIGFHQVD